MKRSSLLVVFVLSVALASSADACETCKRWNNTVTCWSGVQVGRQWCYGGFGEPCVLSEETCLDAEGLKAEPVSPDEVCPNPVAGCAQRGILRAPTGFVLDAQAPVQRAALEEARKQ
jgi:hypothetical protein